MNFYDLQDVNYSYNQKITYTEDRKLYHTPERWEDATENRNQGDCEDYAIAKLHELLRRGWPIEKLRLTFCWVDKEGDDNGHAVLIAEHDDRLWCLDNRFNRIREVIDCDDYVWNTTQEVGGSQNWVSCQKVFSKFYDTTLPPE